MAPLEGQVERVEEFKDGSRRPSLYRRLKGSDKENRHTPERNLQLDLLRCVAILGVLVAHTTLFRTPASWWDRLVVRPSWTGVDLFFVLSGFLISGLLFSEFQKTGGINYRRFAIRRALKLYPTLYSKLPPGNIWSLLVSCR
jgi:peptidoglycan/LPS O-acetylase OafA/YrhL